MYGVVNSQNRVFYFNYVSPVLAVQKCGTVSPLRDGWFLEERRGQHRHGLFTFVAGSTEVP